MNHGRHFSAPTTALATTALLIPGLLITGCSTASTSTVSAGQLPGQAAPAGSASSAAAAKTAAATELGHLTHTAGTAPGTTKLVVHPKPDASYDLAIRCSSAAGGATVSYAITDEDGTEFVTGEGQCLKSAKPVDRTMGYSGVDWPATSTVSVTFAPKPEDVNWQVSVVSAPSS